MADQILEDIARGEGPQHVIEQQWLNPADLDPKLRAVAERAVAAYEAWEAAATELREAAEAALADSRG